MKQLYLALGNPLRGDDGVAGRVLDLLDGLPEQASKLLLHQLTPEVAADLQGIDVVYFLDADLAAETPRIVRIDEEADRLAGSHIVTPAVILHLARQLYDFAGEAYLCRIPARDFDFRDQLSPQAEAQALAAAALLRQVALPDAESTCPVDTAASGE